MGEADAVLDRLLGGTLQPCVNRQLEPARGAVAAGGAERADDPTARVDGDLLPDEAAVEQAVVRRLDPGLADQLSRLVAAIAAIGELLRADLAEHSQELAPKRALRVAP